MTFSDFIHHYAPLELKSAIGYALALVLLLAGLIILQSKRNAKLRMEVKRRCRIFRP